MSFNKFPLRIVEENGPTPFLEKRNTDVSEYYSTTVVQHLCQSLYTKATKPILAFQHFLLESGFLQDTRNLVMYRHTS